MSQVSFFEDFFGRGATQNAHLFDLAICTADLTQAKVEVIDVGNAQYPGVGWLRILAYGVTGNIPACSNKHYCSIILASPEVRANKNPTMSARVMLRSDYPLDHQELLIAFTKVGQDGHAADDIVGFRARSDTSAANWFGLHKVSGSETTFDTLLKVEQKVPREFSVSMSPKVTLYSIDGRVVWERRADAPTSDMNVEFGSIIY